VSPRIFVFTARKPKAQRNLAISIKNRIDEKTVFGSFAPTLRKELERIRDERNSFYACGAVPGPKNTPNWMAMERGDYVLCMYSKTYHYVARVLAKYHNERFARRVWGEDEDGQTWEYMYFLTEPLEIDRRVSEFEGYLNAVYRGFTRISDKQLDAIRDDYGSIEGFIKEILEYEGNGLPDELLLAPDRSKGVGESSLQVDDIAHGTVDEKVIPDSEGRKRIVQHVSYERSPKNREMAIEIHGTVCQICGFEFDEVYGRDYADSYIEIHHVRPLSEHEGEVDPATDLVPLCANCHRMAHRRRTAVTSIEELKALIEEASG
jgi:hypothetical protein